MGRDRMPKQYSTLSRTLPTVVTSGVFDTASRR
jgi:hypothetical protein